MSAPRDPRPYGVYGRISSRKRGDGQGAYVKIDKQLAEGESYVLTKLDDQATFIRYQDNMSGWDPDVIRDDYEAMMSDLREGRLAGTVAWHADRYTRQPEQLERQFTATDRGKAQMHTVMGGHVKSRVMIRIMMALAAEESDHKSERMRNHHKLLAERGVTPGGRRRFGYTDHTMLTIDKAEARIIRDLAARLLQGESLGSLARSLEERNIPTPEGKSWRGQNVRNLLMRPHLAGLRTHTARGEDVATLHDAKWSAILDRETHEAILEHLSDPDRRSAPPPGRVYLLSGLAVCDVCETKLRARKLWKESQKGRDVRAYFCPNGHVSRRRELVDAVIDEAVIDRLSRSDVADALLPDEELDELAELEEEKQRLQEKLSGLTAKNLDGKLSDEQLERSTKQADERIATIDSQLRAARDRAKRQRPPAGMEKLIGPDAAELWSDPDMTLDRRRAIIRYLFERIAVRPSGRGFRFDPEDVRIKRRELEDAAA